ncbi:hypothetical protein C7974DRAFT_412463 [Boeremia exigua]|uniref:uncharacterized protein n=1 Tax=Boeremia exigua TaxID=749465 RepID=UPI001E8DD4C6|nr:uncharacterized protein C7974DRAFT_412463 [Boeremia exigua]KAH6633477.1 hypothetical protein C7974DRAFT_412463 [Boeremia exigua]
MKLTLVVAMALSAPTVMGAPSHEPPAAPPGPGHLDLSTAFTLLLVELLSERAVNTTPIIDLSTAFSLLLVELLSERAGNTISITDIARFPPVSKKWRKKTRRKMIYSDPGASNLAHPETPHRSTSQGEFAS